MERLEGQRRRGLRVSVLDEAPELTERLVPYWRAFLQLHSRRPVGYPPSGIGFMDVGWWLDLFGVDDREERSFWAEVLMAIDDEWLSLMRTKEMKDAGTEHDH